MQKIFWICVCMLWMSAHAAPVLIPKTQLTAEKQRYLHVTSASGTQVFITQAQIQAMGANTLTQLLQNVSGVHVSFSNDATSPTISIRGFGDNASNNSLILLNGFPLENPDMDASYLNLIPINQIKAIQIQPESASVLYGSGAVGGVINIITKTPQQFTAGAELGAGSYAGNSQSVFVSDRKQHWHYRVHAKKFRTDNSRPHNNLNEASGLATVGYQDAVNQVDMDFHDNFLTEQYPGSTLYPSNSNYQQVHYHAVLLRWKHHFNTHWAFDNHLEYRNSNTNGYMDGNFTQDRWSIVWLPKLIGTLPFDHILTTSGMQIQKDRYRMLSSSFSSLDKSVKNNRHALFSHWQIPLSTHYRLVLGARWAEQNINVTTAAKDERAFVSEQSFIYQPQKDWRFYVRRAGSYRFPKADELGANNQILKTQTGISYETGFTWQPKNALLQLEAYMIDLNNEIAYAAPNPNDPLDQNNRNINPTRRLGILLHGQYHVTKHITVFADLNAVNAYYRAGSFSGRKVPMVPDKTAKLGTRIGFAKHWSWYLATVYTSGFYAAGDDLNQHVVSGYTTVNSNVNYAIQHWLFSVRLNNLLNRQYSTYTVFSPYAKALGEYPAPGRNIWLSVRYAFH